MNEKKKEDVPVSSGNTTPTYAQFKTRIESLSDRQRREFATWCAERVRRLLADPLSTNVLDAKAWAAAVAVVGVGAWASDVPPGAKGVFAVWDAERDAQFAEMGRILKEVQP